MIVFDDAASRSKHWKTDRFAAFCDMFERFNNNCAKNMAPDDFLAIDETLYPTRDGVSFKTYNKDKPAKYGLNFRSLGSWRHPCVYYTIPYTGKPEVTDAHIKDSMTLVKKIVEGYETNGFNLSGTNISMDRYYTSIPIVEWLYEKKFFCIAKMNSNRKGLPTEIKEIKGHEVNLWMACKIDGSGIIINLYVVKAKSGMRNVLLLTTMEPAHYVTDDKKKKPYMYKIYDFTKGGIDIPDQRVGTYTCKVKTTKWMLVALSYVLDMARTNSQTLYKINNEKTEVDRFEFGWELAKSLVKNFMLERLQKGGLTAYLKNILQLIAEGNENQAIENTANKALSPDNIPKPCKTCIIESHGTGHKDLKNKFVKVKARCAKCQHPVCKKLSHNIYELCRQ